jgi:acetyltransferase-like isoleucine patch superfamily enzyme
MIARIRLYLRWLPAKLGYQKGPLLASWLRKRWLLLRHPHVDITIGKGAYLGPGFSLQAPDGGALIVGDNVDLRRNVRIEIVGDGRVSIGAGSYLMLGAAIGCSTSVEIGERVGIGMCCSIYDGNHRYRDLSKPMLQQGYDHRPILIEDDAAIFNLSTVTNSVGRRGIVGANSVVTKPVPAYTLAAGAPARPIEYFGPDGAAADELVLEHSR